MKKVNFLKASLVVAIMLTAGACSKTGEKSISQQDHPKAVIKEMMAENGANPDEISIKENSGASPSQLNSSVSNDRDKGHFLYTESNAAEGNSILIYKIKKDGSLNASGSTLSGGKGTGKGLGSQGALELDKNHEWLYAVNGGSNSVSSFKVNNDGSLTLAHTASSGGLTPNSVSAYGNLLYVLNNKSDNILGLRIGAGGTLTPIEGAAQHLSGSVVDAPQISFSPNGDWVIVTEKATNIIGTFKVKSNGSVNSGIFTASIGATPFGFDFSRDRFMIVSNAAGGAVGAGSATSYIINNSGVPDDINGAVPDLQAAPCWFAITKYGRFAYTTNTAGNTISSYYIDESGGLHLAESLAATTDTQPLDIVIAANNYFVYELNGKGQTIGEFRRKLLGGLELIATQPGLPVSSTGLATY